VSVTDGRSRQAQAHRLLRAAMTTAVTDGVIDTQPCRIPGAGTPRRTLGRTPQVADRLLSPGQVAAIATAMPPRYRALVLAAAWSGLRQGELLALTRADLDLAVEPAVVRVRRGVRRSDAGTVEAGLPKTAASVRTVSLPRPLADALAAHLEAFVPDHPGAPVFATSRGTLPARSNLNTTFRRALDAAGAPQVRFHDLRHVAQVFAAEAGATPKEGTRTRPSARAGAESASSENLAASTPSKAALASSTRAVFSVHTSGKKRPVASAKPATVPDGSTAGTSDTTLTTPDVPMEMTTSPGFAPSPSAAAALSPVPGQSVTPCEVTPATSAGPQDSRQRGVVS
jgi:hypothetical protein